MVRSLVNIQLLNLILKGSCHLDWIRFWSLLWFACRNFWCHPHTLTFRVEGRNQSWLTKVKYWCEVPPSYVVSWANGSVPLAFPLPSGPWQSIGSPNRKWMSQIRVMINAHLNTTENWSLYTRLSKTARNLYWLPEACRKRLFDSLQKYRINARLVFSTRDNYRKRSPLRKIIPFSHPAWDTSFCQLCKMVEAPSYLPPGEEATSVRSKQDKNRTQKCNGR